MEGGVFYLFALLNFKYNKILLDILCETGVTLLKNVKGTASRSYEDLEYDTPT